MGLNEPGLQMVNFTKSSARRALRHLKRGVFPPLEIEQFTAGRDTESSAVGTALREVEEGSSRHFFIEANYGYGKSHMLKVVESLALTRGFAVCWITTDGYAHAFNHPTRYLHAMLENIRIPGLPRPGLSEACNHWLKNNEREHVLSWANNHAPMAFRWPITTMSTEKQHEDYYREWFLNRLEGRDLQHKNGLPHFPEVFDRLAATTSLCRVAGLKGTVFLFDEVESVATLLTHIKSRMLSYQLINSFIDARRFPHSLFVFATTLDFGIKLRIDSAAYDSYDYGYPDANRFAKKWLAEEVKLLKLRPITTGDNRKLLHTVRSAHEVAYGWPATERITDDFVNRFLERTKPHPQREIIRAFVTILEISQLHATCNPSQEFLGEPLPSAPSSTQHFSGEVAPPPAYPVDQSTA